MAEKQICNYRLRRTLPKLSGNMQLDVIVSPIGSVPGVSANMLQVTQAHLRPIGSDTYVPVVDERIMDRPHQLNIKRFYERTRSSFYTHPYDPILNSDWPRMVSYSELDNIKYIKRWDDLCFAGCKRMRNKLYGCTHEILVPVWIDQADGLRFTLHIMSKDSDDIGSGVSAVLDLSPIYLNARWTHGGKNYKYFAPDLTFHNDFVNYMIDYLDYSGAADGDPNVLSVDYQQNVTAIHGMLVESGNITTRNNLNIARNLIYRERPLLESNSLLTNSFMDNKMIVKQLMNFNICFNLDEMLSLVQGLGKFTDNTRFKVCVSVEVLRKYKDISTNVLVQPDWTASPMSNVADKDRGYVWQSLDVRDFYTNHYYVPRPVAKTEYIDGEQNTYEVNNSPLNALLYKRDHMCSDIMHANKLIQPICHWVDMCAPDGDLFNVYDGFGAYTIKDGQIIEYNHGFGQTGDVNDSEYDEFVDNTAWLGAKMKGTGATIQNILNNPLPYVENGFFSDASNYINGLKFTYNASSVNFNNTSEKSAPSKVYIGVMTTPKNCQLSTLWNSTSTEIKERSVINILTEREGENYVEGQPVWGNLPQYQNQQETDFDKKYDWHLYSDGDNRYAVNSNKLSSKYRIYFDPTGDILNDGGYFWLDSTVSDKEVITTSEIPTAARKITTDITRSMLMRIGGTGDANYALREYDNSNSLYIAYRRYPVNEDMVPTASDPLYVIFFQPEAEAHSSTSEVIYRNLRPHALTPGRLIEAIQEYWNKYKPIYDILVTESNTVDGDGVANITLPDGTVPDMDDLSVIQQIFSSIAVPEVIYFDRTIRTRQDITLSIRAHEVNYLKDTGANAYVWRYSSSIRPVMSEHNYLRQNDVLYFSANPSYWGRNFLWQKEPIFPIGQKSSSYLTQYIQRGIPPIYPSLGFDTVTLVTVDKPGETYNPQGDLMYEEVPMQYLGCNNAGQEYDVLTAQDFVTPEEFVQYKNLSLNSIPGLSDSVVTDNDKKLYDNGLRSLILDGRYDPNAIKSQPTEIVYWLYKPDYKTYEWPEYKWFDQSIVTNLPTSLTYVIQSNTNDKSDLENIALLMMLGGDDRENYLSSVQPHDDGIIPQKSLEYDFAYLRNTYDFEYNLIKVEPKKESNVISRDEHTNKVLYSYIYEIIVTLK